MKCCYVGRAMSARKLKRGPKRRYPTLTLEGKTLGVDTWSKMIGFPAATIMARLKRGLPMEQVLSPVHLGGVSGHHCKFLTKDGERKSMSECAKELGISLSAMSRRVSRGKKDLFSPRNHHGVNPKYKMPEYKKWLATRTHGAAWSWEEFMAEVGLQPSELSILARKDSSKPWSKGNTRWVTTSGGRTSPCARMIRYKGETLSLRGWALRCGINRIVLWFRLKRGWPLEKALTTPPGNQGRRKNNIEFTGP